MIVFALPNDCGARAMSAPSGGARDARTAWRGESVFCRLRSILSVLAVLLSYSAAVAVPTASATPAHGYDSAVPSVVDNEGSSVVAPVEPTDEATSGEVGAAATGGASAHRRHSSRFVAPRLPGVGDDVVVIGKVDDLNATTLAPGERTLLDQLPNQGSPRAIYVQSDRVLRTEMSRGVPIRDASVSPTTGELVNNTGFLRAERDIWSNHGWPFDTKSGYWLPPG